MKNGSGIVIEVTNKKATLLMRDGTFVTVKVPAGKKPLVGNEYQASYFSQRKRSLFVLPSISLSVAALVAFLFISGLMPTSSQPAAAAYVSFDINPSLEVGVDEDMNVIEIDTFNEEAKHIIEKYNLSADDSLLFEIFADQLIKAYEAEGYMKADQSMLITTISKKSSNKETETALDQAVNTIVKKAVVQYPVVITVSETSEDTRKKAKQLGVSSGRYTAFQKAKKNGKPYTEKKIKEVEFQELKVNASSEKDIKVVPHPRQIQSPKHEIKQEIKQQPRINVDHKIKQSLDHKQHMNKTKEEKIVNPKKSNSIQSNKHDKINNRNNGHSQKEKKAVSKERKPKEFVKKQMKNNKSAKNQQQKQHKNKHKH